MRIVQNILLVIGASTLGAVICVVLAFLAAAIGSAPRAGEQASLNWGAAIAFTFLGIGGGIVGAIVGFVSAIRWIAKRESELWTLAIWFGVALGMAIALLVRFSGWLDQNLLGDLIKWWPGLALFGAAMASLGGFIGGVVKTLISPDRGSSTRTGKR